MRAFAVGDQVKDHLIFDLDGTLTDPKVGILRCINGALESCGMGQLDESATGSLWVIGPPLRDVFKRLVGDGANEQLIERLVKAYRERYEQTGIFECSLYPGIHGLLQDLARSNRKLAIATSKPAVYAKRIIKHYDLGGLFRIVAGSELDGRNSTKVEVIREVLESSGTDGGAKDCLMIGDRDYDISAARELGMDSVGVLYGFGTEDEITLAKPTYIVPTVRELRNLLLEA